MNEEINGYTYYYEDGIVRNLPFRIDIHTPIIHVDEVEAREIQIRILDNTFRIINERYLPNILSKSPIRFIPECFRYFRK